MLTIEAVSKNIFKLISRQSPKAGAIGLDIGTSSVKLVKIDYHNSIPAVSAIAIEKIEGDDFSGAVKAVMNKAALAEKRVNLGISGKQAIIRCVLMPEMDEAAFKSSMKYEAAKHIPFPAKDTLSDSAILKHNAGENKMLVLVAAAKGDFVRQRLEAVLRLGLEAGLIDMDSLAVVNIFNVAAKQTEQILTGDKKEKAVMSALLNIGARTSNLSLLEDGILRFSRDIVFGGASITQKIAEKLKIGVDEAEKIKLSYGRQDELAAVTEAALGELATELRLSFDYYESQTGKAVGCVCLSGGGALLTGIDKFMAAAMNINFKLWDPFKGLEIDASVDKELAVKSSQSFAVAAGLALRR